MAGAAREIWITGIGLVSSLGAGAGRHWDALTAASPRPIVDEAAFGPYPVHPLAEIDLTAQIPKRSDFRQMEGWQRIGVFAAGLALDDAGITGSADLLGRTHIVAAAGNGERDPQADRAVLEGAAGPTHPELNAALLRELRPTLYLGQQSQLLAGNISIVHHVTGASRTYKGEEIAGAQAVQDAIRRIAAGSGDVFLVGGACNAQRWDQLLTLELGARLWRGAYRPVWERREAHARPPLHGGMITGSVGAFLVLEEAGHAARRGAAPYARIAGIEIAPSSADAGSAAARMRRFVNGLGVGKGRLPVISGASGFDGPAGCTSRELAALDSLEIDGISPAIRAHGSMLGHGLEAHFPAGLALAALAARRRDFYAPFDESGVERGHDGAAGQVLVTGTGNASGEALALLAAVRE
jgi:3-oxoacyl-[acyl-carrier-protein] synthase II